MRDFLNDAFKLMMTLKACVSPFHAVKNAEEKLMNNGFERLYIEDLWSLECGGRYFVNVYGSTLFAFTIGQNYKSSSGVRIAAAHTDWPCLRIKPNPEVVKNGYAAVNVEVYGGPIINTWLDRPLSIAGRVTVKGENEFAPKSVLVDFRRSLLTIPNIAIHLNREINKGVELNKQNELLPIIGMIEDELNNKNYFMELLAEEAKVRAEDILSYDLYVYNADASQLLGMSSDFISSPRLDNVTGIEACINGILSSDNKDSVNMSILYDNEEIGSRTKQGAGGIITGAVLEKLMYAVGISREEYLASLFKSMMLSVDVAHGMHPHHPEKYDITSKALLNGGIAIKTNSNQNYATDGMSIGVVKGICETNGIPYQMLANRSDIAGGSTLGAISSAFTAIATVDIGVPLLAMHSARELMGAKDMAYANELVIDFFNT